MIDWTALIQECAPQVSPSVMHAVIRAESGFNPFAININGNVRLARTASTKDEAVRWAKWLISQGYSVDLGVMQINSSNLHRLGLDVFTAFDACKNLTAGAAILARHYSRAIQQTPDSEIALLKAISAYNSGNFQTGFNNGYVQKVVQPAKVYLQVEPIVPPLKKVASKNFTYTQRPSVENKEISNLNDEIVNKSLYSAETAIKGFGTLSNQSSWGSASDLKK